MRYLPLTDEERARILKLCGVSSFEELISQVPADLRLKSLLNIPDGLSEGELEAHLRNFAMENKAAFMQCHLGQGAYAHDWPSVIDQLTNRGEFLTAYTPYQPELAQGTLQAVFEFQSMIAELFDMDIANASLYDGSTALVEAILMAARIKKIKSGTVLLSEGIFDHTKKILETYLKPRNFKLVTWNADKETFLSLDTSVSSTSEAPFVVVLQSPNKWGLIEDWKRAKTLADKFQAVSIAHVAHPTSLALFEAPGSCQMDIATGEAQALGIPLGFGGPYLGLMACKEAFVRQLPGRLVGLTEDERKNRAFCVTLATREQHIRREKATSNICSNQNLMALRTAMYLTLMGREGLKELAHYCRDAAFYAREKISKALAELNSSVQVLEGELFNEISLLIPSKSQVWAEEFLAHAESRGILAGLKTSAPLDSSYACVLTLAFTERHSPKQIDQLVTELRSL